MVSESSPNLRRERYGKDNDRRVIYVTSPSFRY